MSALLVLLLLGSLAGCRGVLLFSGDLWLIDDDDSATDDDDSAPGDDDDSALGDDDDVANDDDVVGDDDDATPIGGPVFCGPNVIPGSDSTGKAVSVYTGDARVAFDHDARGGFFAAEWTGCEAKHFFDADGEYVCGIKWSVNGVSYGEQYQTTRLVTRFAMDWTLDDNTCSATDPEVFRVDNYYRITVPYESGTLEVLVSDDDSTVPTQMDEWVGLPWDGNGEDEPDLVEFDYATSFSPSR